MDNAVIGRGSFVAAGSLVTPNTVVPPGSFVRGAPAKVIRPVEARDTESIAYSWKHYRETMQIWRSKAT
jgi:carbonic anhydrase/acetyltransferase-like protein (isoleucine patch superfamily)